MLRKRFVPDCMTFVLAAGLFLCLCAVLNITPFGDGSFLVYDMKRQYVDFFSYYKTLFTTENDLRYSLSNGLGGEMPGFFAYYLTSPLNLLFLAVPHVYFPQALTALLCLKTGLAAVTMRWFLKFDAAEAGRESGEAGRIVLAVGYAFCGHFVMNLSNTIWQDAYLFAPVFFLASLSLMKSSSEEKDDPVSVRRRFVYCALAAAVFVWLHYYIAFMVLVFTFVWMVYRLIRLNVPMKRFLLWCVSCVTGALLTGALLVPTALALADSAKGEGSLARRLFASLSRTGLGIYAPAEVFRRLLPLQFTTDQVYEGGPQIYVGVVLLVLAVLYYIHVFRTRGAEASSWKRGRELLFLTLFLLVCFLFPPFDLVLHGGSAPWGYRFRYAFLFCFVLTVAAARCTSTITLQGKKRLLAAVFLSGLLLADLFVNAVLTVRAMSYNMEQASVFADRVKQTQAALEDAGIVNGQFAGSDLVFRMESLSPRSENDASAFAYNGVTHYNSEGNFEQYRFLQALGMNYDGHVAIYDAYHLPQSVRSFLGISFHLDPDRETLIQQEAFPMAFVLTDDYDAGTGFDALTNPFDRMNLFYKEIVFRTWGGSDGSDHPVYFYMAGLPEEPQNLSVFVDDTFVSGYGNASSYRTLRLSSGNVTVKEEDGTPAEGEIVVVTEDTDLLMKRISEFSGREVLLHKLTSSHLRAEVPSRVLTDPKSNTDRGDASRIGLLLPYHRGWSASVNGVACKIERFFGGYMLVTVPEEALREDARTESETYDIDLVFLPPGLRAGKVCTAAGAGIVVYNFFIDIYHILEKRRKNEIRERAL